MSSNFKLACPVEAEVCEENHVPFINKTLSKEIMQRTKLFNKFLKDRTDETKKIYSLQQNYCVSLLRKTEKEYNRNLDKKR